MGFAFCKKIEDDKFETVQPISPCKDYLNDVLAAERLMTPAETCGLKYTPQGIFPEGKSAYLAFKIVGYQAKNMGGEYAKKYNPYADEVRLHETYRKIQGILNDIEGQLNFESTTIIERGKDNTFLCTVPHEWLSSTYMVSLYSLIIRTGQYFTPVLRPVDLLLTLPVAEQSLWPKAKEHLTNLLKKKTLYKQEFLGIPGSYHSRGIVSLPVPV